MIRLPRTSTFLWPGDTKSETRRREPKWRGATPPVDGGSRLFEEEVPVSLRLLSILVWRPGRPLKKCGSAALGGGTTDFLRIRREAEDRGGTCFEERNRGV